MAKKAAKRKKATRRVSAAKPGKAAQAAQKRPNGRPPFRPTEDDRKRVELMAAILPQDKIAQLVYHPKTGKPIGEKTLRRHFRAELDNGKAKVDAKIAETMVARAMSLSHPQGFQAGRFYLATRAGWTEKSTLEVEGKAGVLVAPGTMSVEEWLAKVAERNANAVEPGLEEPDD